jgi:type II secretory pathway pseudopilin PulG
MFSNQRFRRCRSLGSKMLLASRTALAGGIRRGAFSLIEALIALSITSMAGAVLLLSVQSSLETTIEAVQRTIADGVAQQTMDEITTKRFVGPAENPLTSVLGPLTSEILNDATALFDDADDYAGYVAQPVKGTYGEILGTGDDNGDLRLQNFRVRSDYFDNWRIRVDVYFVDPNDHTVRSASPTNFRAVDVHVELMRDNGAAIPLSSRRRVFAYLPPPST